MVGMSWVIRKSWVEEEEYGCQTTSVLTSPSMSSTYIYCLLWLQTDRISNGCVHVLRSRRPEQGPPTFTSRRSPKVPTFSKLQFLVCPSFMLQCRRKASLCVSIDAIIGVSCVLKVRQTDGADVGGRHKIGRDGRQRHWRLSLDRMILRKCCLRSRRNNGEGKERVRYFIL